MQIKNPKLLFLSLAICLGIGFLSSIFTISSIPTWYASLNKPFFNPPNYIFGPVWTALYTLMAISLYLVLIKKSKDYMPVRYFSAQLALNFLWSFIFFNIHAPKIAFMEILFLFAFILLSIRSFYRISKLASYLLIPYALWVSFAAILNLSIVLLNP